MGPRGPVDTVEAPTQDEQAQARSGDPGCVAWLISSRAESGILGDPPQAEAFNIPACATGERADNSSRPLLWMLRSRPACSG